jgi:ATP-dependent DNA helicase RecQ
MMRVKIVAIPVSFARTVTTLEPMSEPATVDQARHVLLETFGYPSFRGHQEAAVTHLIEGGDALVLMPTGGGKSICYQVPALVRDGTGLVVSPLIALMQDQVDSLRAAGVRAGFLNSTQNADERRTTERDLVEGRLDLLYMAPERLQGAATLRLLGQTPLSVIAIDEAHCVSQWGHDFRPEYLELATLGEAFPGVPRVALTATATVETREEIVERLALLDARRFVASFDRPNIRYRIVAKESPRRQLLDLIRDEHRGQAGIVYCLSRSSVEQTAEFLNDEGVAAVPYHAGLNAATRAAHQARFLREDGLVVVATIAFGMGIDKPDVRFVAHLDLPRSVEGYYQETGRAGRDGAEATALLAYGLADVVQQRRFIDDSSGDLAFRRRASSQLDAMLALCETVECRRVQMLAYFGEASEPCGNCDTCLDPPQSWDATIAAQKVLSTVSRLKRERHQSFGAGQIIAILRGQATEKVKSMRHDQLTTFGVGQEFGDAEWRGVIRQLLAQGLLGVVGEYATLTLTAASAAVLRGEREVRMRREPPKRRGRTSAVASKTAGSREALSGEQQQRFDSLRTWRAEVARAAGIPAYVIFHDETLRLVARRNPTTAHDLHGISGVGAVKLERYGPGLLAALQEHAVDGTE